MVNVLCLDNRCQLCLEMVVASPGQPLSSAPSVLASRLLVPSLLHIELGLLPLETSCQQVGTADGPMGQLSILNLVPQRNHERLFGKRRQTDLYDVYKVTEGDCSSVVFERTEAGREIPGAQVLKV